MPDPDPNNSHPITGLPQMCFIKNTEKNPNIIVGDYTYYDDPEDAAEFERNVLYHYPVYGINSALASFTPSLEMRNSS